MAQGDPTDHALAAIASILDRVETSRESQKPAATEQRPAPLPIPIAHPPIEAHGYCKTGPGPMAAIRFKWTVREDQGQFYVDETIGENSTPVVSGPMDKAAAMRFVNDREQEARLRFEQLKQEMAGRSAAANLVRRDSSGEA